jgi:hypothetical protein
MIQGTRHLRLTLLLLTALLSFAAIPLAATIKTLQPQFQQPTVIPTGSWPSGIESADLNNDGRPDLIDTDHGATATASATHILLNHGDGTFTPGQTIATAGASIAVADFDQDGHPDLEWVWSVPGECRVYFAKGNGDGTFAPTVLVGTFAQIGTAVPHFDHLLGAKMHGAEMNGGGPLDLLVEDTANNTLFELTADATGTLVRLFGLHLPDGTGPMITADLNGDGHTDLILQGSTAIDVYLGASDGVITTPARYAATTSAVRSLLLHDFDSDGHPDLLVETASGITLLHGFPDGTFATASSGGTASLDPATGAGGHLIGIGGTAATPLLYTRTAAGVSLLEVQPDLSLRLRGIYNAGPGQSSYVLADFNNDGIPDLAVDSPEGIAILFCNPDGSPQTSRSYSTGRPALSAAVGVFTTSGNLDTIVTTDAKPQLLHGLGDGTFTASATTLAPASTLLTGDFNADGILDLATRQNSTLAIQYGLGDGTFTPPTPILGTLPGQAIAAHLSTPATTDIVIADTLGLHIFTPSSSGTFSRVDLTSTPATLIATGDLSHDGKPDLLYQTGNLWNVALNQGSLKFTPTTLANPTHLTATSALITDLDGDGNGDVAILFDNPTADHAHPSPTTPNQIYLWYGKGDGTFDAPILLTPSRNFNHLAAIDINATGHPDLVMSDGYLLAILRNLGARSFGPEQHLLACTGINSISSGDVNHDGTTDLILTNGNTDTTNPGGGITVLLNKLAIARAVTATATATTVVFTVTTPTTLFFGQSVDGFAQVTASDSSTITGTVTFYDGPATICVITIEQNTSCPDTTGTGFAVGSHSLKAIYAGDPTHAAATSATVIVTIIPDLTTATLTTSLTPAPFGQTIALTATLHGNFATPIGPVTFYDGPTILGTAALNSAGKALFQTSSLAPGTHTLSAVYAATPSFNAASTNALLQTILGSTKPTPTAVTVSSNLNPATLGQNILFTASAVTIGTASLPPTGIVTFQDSGVTIGTAPLNPAGLATFSTSSLTTGTHTITATYAGDSSTAASTSAPFSQVITPAAISSNATFTISAGATTLPTGTSINVAVKVAPINGFNQAVQLSCTNLPHEASCTFTTDTVAAGGGTTTFRLTTLSPRDCGTSTGYNESASNTSRTLPYAAPILTGVLIFLLPKRRRAWKGLLTLIATASFLTLTGCGVCTDLGTRPGIYTLKIIGKSTGTNPVTVTQSAQITVTP